VIISWFLSPLLAALITLVLFLLIRTLVLRRARSTKIAFWVLPILILLTFFINLFFILVSALMVLHWANPWKVVPLFQHVISIPMCANGSQLQLK
jgi:sodium-dependent phosphate transporter